MRPKSIVVFERLYLGAWLLRLVILAIEWTAYRGLPQMRQADTLFGPWFVPLTAAIGLLLPLVLWYFVARRGSVVAKWIVVVLAAVGLLGMIAGVFTGTMISGLGTIVSFAAVAFQVAAAAMLFRPNARPWFGKVSRA